MSSLSIWLKAFRHCAGTINHVLFDSFELLRLATKSRGALMAENLFLRKQLAMFQERNVRLQHAQDSFALKIRFSAARYSVRNRSSRFTEPVM